MSVFVRKKISCLVAVLLGAIPGWAGGELTRISQAYQQAPHLTLSVQVMIYATPQDQTGKLFGKGTMYRSNGNYYCKFRNTETLINGDCSIIADHENKELICLPPADKKIRQPKNMLADVDSLLTANDSVVRRGLQGTVLHYTIFSKSGEIQRIEVYADTSDYFVRKMEYYYAPSPDDADYGVYKAVIVYSGISTQKVQTAIFDEKKFVTRKNGNWQAVGTYQSYQLILN